MTQGVTADPGLVVVAGDWGHPHGWGCTVARRLPHLLPDERPRIILQLGDFGIGAIDGDRTYLNTFANCLRRARAECWVVPGNHEHWPWIRGLEPDGTGKLIDPRMTQPGRVRVLPAGYRWAWHGRTWLAAGGAVSLDRGQRQEGYDWWPDEELTDAQADTIIAAGPADVILTHDAPAGVPYDLPGIQPAWSLKAMAAAEVHRDRIQRIYDGVKPQAGAHGHLHLASQRITQMAHGPVTITCLNEEGRRWNYLTWDTRDLTWISGE